MNKSSNTNYERRIAPFDYKSQVELLRCLHPSKQMILDYILMLANRFEYIFPNQTTLGKKADVGRIQANRIVKWLFEHGLIEKCYQPNNPCLYRPALFLMHPQIRYEFKDVFSAFKSLSLVMLFASFFVGQFTGVESGNVTRREMDIRKNSSINISFISIPPSIEIPNIDNVSICMRTKGRPSRMYVTEDQKKAILKTTHLLKLSKVGQIKLTAFPSEALEYTLDKFKRVDTNKLKDGFSFFISVCKEWCKMHNMPEDKQTVNTLLAKYKLDWYGSPVFHGNGMDGRERKENSQKGERQQSKTWQGHEKARISPIVAAYEAGDALEAEGKDGFEMYAEAQRLSGSPNYQDARAYRAAYDCAQSAPDHIKQEWADQYKTRPHKFSPPVQRVIQEFMSGKVEQPPENGNMVSEAGPQSIAQILRSPAFSDGRPIEDYAAYDDGQNNDEVELYQMI